MDSFIYRPFIIAPIVLFSAFTLAWGDNRGVFHPVGDVPITALSIEQQNRLSDIAVQALQQMAAARAYLARRNAGRAHQALDNTGTLLNSLQASFPAARPMPDMVPISANLHTLQDLLPAPQVPAYPGTTRLRANAKQPSAEALHATDSALMYAEADLPLAHTQHAVDRARRALDQQHWRRADNALKNAEDGIVFMSVSVNAPLTAGRQSLQQTTRLLAAGETTQARVELQRARSNLQRAAQTTDNIAQTGAYKLLQDANRLDTRIRNGDANLVSDAQILWYRTAALAERSNAYLGDAWARMMYAQPIKSKLIEGRLMLRDADIDQFTAHRPAAVETALAHTQNYLDQALQIARNDKQPQTEILVMKKHVARLAATPPAQRSQAQYSQLAGELAVLISPG